MPDPNNLAPITAWMYPNNPSPRDWNVLQDASHSGQPYYGYWNAAAMGVAQPTEASMLTNEAAYLAALGNIGLYGGITYMSNNAIVLETDGYIEMLGLHRWGDTFYNGTSLFFARSRGTKQAPVRVGNTDFLGDIRFLGWNGSTWSWGAGIQAVIDGVPGISGDMPTALIFRTSSDDGIPNCDERGRFTPDGGFGVGHAGVIPPGIISALTGFRVNNLAVNNNFLVGNGNAFVVNTPANAALALGINSGASLDWTPTWGGFSAAPTGGLAKYIKIGRLVYCKVYGWSAGTSNATTKTITLPFASALSDTMAGMGHFMNAGTFLTSPGRIDTRLNSTTADLYKDLNAAAWTNTGACVADFSLIYEAAT